MLKTFIAAAALTTSCTLTFSHPSTAAIWYSNSGKTALSKLDSICWGNSRLDSVQTVFGEFAYQGSATFSTPKTRGCVPGDTLRGRFELYNGPRSQCLGTLTVTWRQGNQAHLQ